MNCISLACYVLEESLVTQGEVRLSTEDLKVRKNRVSAFGSSVVVEL